MAADGRKWHTPAIRILKIHRQSFESLVTRGNKYTIDLRIERWPIEQLVPYVRNPRTHTADQVAQVAGSIAEFGFVNPILVGPDNVIIAGHARFGAAQKLGASRWPS